MQAKNSSKVKIILDLIASHANVKGIKGLANAIGEPSTRLYGWIRNGKIFDTTSILTKFPYINKEWLETGEGPMMIIDDSNRDLVPPGKYATDAAGLIRPKVAAKIEPGDAEKRERMRRKALERTMKAQSSSETTLSGNDEEIDVSDMLLMTSVVLKSETVYRSALASNVRAFYQAVIKEEEMQSVNEKLEALQKHNENMAERMERMEQMLLSFGAQVPEKREQGNG